MAHSDTEGAQTNIKTVSVPVYLSSYVQYFFKPIKATLIKHSTKKSDYDVRINASMVYFQINQCDMHTVVLCPHLEICFWSSLFRLKIFWLTCLLDAFLLVLWVWCRCDWRGVSVSSHCEWCADLWQESQYPQSPAATTQCCHVQTRRKMCHENFEEFFNLREASLRWKNIAPVFNSSSSSSVIDTKGRGGATRTSLPSRVISNSCLCLHFCSINHTVEVEIQHMIKKKSPQHARENIYTTLGLSGQPAWLCRSL